jgi:hypothetical protein
MKDILPLRDDRLVNVAPNPIFAGLDEPQQRVMRGVK